MACPPMREDEEPCLTKENGLEVPGYACVQLAGCTGLEKSTRSSVLHGLHHDSLHLPRGKGRTDKSGSYKTKQLSGTFTKSNTYRTGQINVHVSGKGKSTCCRNRVVAVQLLPWEPYRILRKCVCVCVCLALGMGLGS